MTAFLARQIARHAVERPEIAAVVTSALAWTWREIDEGARRVAEALIAAGAGPGTIAVLAMSRGPEVVLALCGARRAGAVPAMVDPSDPAQVAAICAQLRPAAVLVRARDERAARAVGTIALDGATAAAVARPLAWAPRADVVGLSHLIHTSGTTQHGKCIAWSEPRAEADAMTRPPVGAQGDRGRPAIVVPLCVSLGFHDLLRALAHGCSIALVDEPFPLALRVLDELGATGFQCTPTHVDLLLRSAMALPRSLRRINVSSAPISGDQLRALAARVAPAIVTKSYGLTEVGPVAVLRASELAHGDTVGRPLADREVTIVDAQDRVQPAGTTGEIVVRIAAAPGDGYFLAAPAEAQRFAGGVLRTGDRGHFDGDGFLVLETRLAELLKVGGRTVSAPRIEQVLAALGVFADHVVVGVPHRRLGEVPAVAFVPSPDTPALAALERLVADRLEPEARPRWFLARSRLPRTASGKPRRGLIAAELRRWVEAWPDSVTSGARVLPARALTGPGADGSMFATDGAPARWPRWAAARPRDPRVRVISILDAAGVQLFAIACVQPDVSAGALLWIAPSRQRSPLAATLAPVLDELAQLLRAIS